MNRTPAITTVSLAVLALALGAAGLAQTPALAAAPGPTAPVAAVAGMPAVAAAASVGVVGSAVQTPAPAAATVKDYLSESQADRDRRMAWWREARFGMFIHWGIYAVPAGEYKGKRSDRIGEWIMDWAKIPIPEYEKFAAEFNPVKFDADAWVKLAADAGMKYIVITSKHHDGFCMWGTKVGKYNIVDATPYGKDVLKMLADACAKGGVRLCFYHSIMDWHHPDARGANFARYRDEYMKPQLKELLTGYGDVGVLWFDGEWIREWTEPQGKDLYNYVRSLKPDIIINNRVGKGRQGMKGLTKDATYAGDFGTPEQEIPATGVKEDWESCMTMNDTWGYKHYDQNWKSSRTLIRNLIDIASKGGNYLLNVGPTAEGLIPQPSVERLEEIGRWMKVNGESIHGTQASPFQRPAWGRFTRKPGRLYAHVFDWPKDGKLGLPDVASTKAYLLADPQRKPLTLLRGEGKLDVSLPATAPDQVASVVVLELEGGAQPAAKP